VAVSSDEAFFSTVNYRGFLKSYSINFFKSFRKINTKFTLLDSSTFIVRILVD